MLLPTIAFHLLHELCIWGEGVPCNAILMMEILMQTNRATSSKTLAAWFVNTLVWAPHLFGSHGNATKVARAPAVLYYSSNH